MRLSSIHTSDPYALYESNNNDLKPGDHVEVQMRQGSETYGNSLLFLMINSLYIYIIYLYYITTVRTIKFLFEVIGILIWIMNWDVDWCYGVIGHLDSCGRYWNNDHCSCEHSGKLLLVLIIYE